MGKRRRDAEVSEEPPPVEDSVFSSGTFQELGLAPFLADHLHGRMGYKSPTLAQEAAIPLLIAGRDVLVNSRTGTGKTVSYLAPLVHNLQAFEPKITRVDGTFAMILVPTRELCIQVCAVAEQLVHRFHWLVPGHVMGGENRSKEKARLRKGITILVATPGRLLDHMKNTSSFVYKRLRWLVLDEADRLLDMGFERDIENILALLDSQKAQHEEESVRQHVLLSATLNEGVNRLAALSLKNPATVGQSCLQLKAKKYSQKSTSSDKNEPPQPAQDYVISDKLVQSYIKAPSKVRLVTLFSLLRSKINSACGPYKMVIFFSTCDAVDFHHSIFSSFSWSLDKENADDAILEGFFKCDVFRLHGNVEQKERTDAFQRFAKAQTALLLCTDVAARGLDFHGLNCIVQYDPPGEAVDYVHRVGRTARLGNKGEAVLFLQPCETDYLTELQNHGVTLKEMSLRNILDYMYVGTKKRKREDFEVAEMHPAATLMQRSLESYISSQVELKQLASDAFRSYVRAYAAHRGNLKRIFQVRKLHLGHMAKSFGLEDTPSLIGKSGSKKNKKKIPRNPIARRRMANKKKKNNHRLHAAKMME